MRIVRNVLVTLVVIVAVLAIVGLFLPASVHVERSAQIDAPPAIVFDLVNDLQEFNRWSPWARLDPDTRYEFDGPGAGHGAKMSWYSEDPSVGSGTSEIIESRRPTLVRNQLDFGSHGQAIAFYRLEDAAGGTNITWGFDTEFGYNLLGRYMGLFFDDWVGSDYEKGLANLKTLAEREAG